MYSYKCYKHLAVPPVPPHTWQRDNTGRLKRRPVPDSPEILSALRIYFRTLERILYLATNFPTPSLQKKFAIVKPWPGTAGSFLHRGKKTETDRKAFFIFFDYCAFIDSKQ